MAGRFSLSALENDDDRLITSPWDRRFCHRYHAKSPIVLQILQHLSKLKRCGNGRIGEETRGLGWLEVWRTCWLTMCEIYHVQFDRSHVTARQINQPVRRMNAVWRSRRICGAHEGTWYKDEPDLSRTVRRCASPGEHCNRVVSERGINHRNAG